MTNINESQSPSSLLFINYYEGEPAEDGVAISRTAFHSSLVLEDLEHAPIPQSTQRGQYVAYAAQEPESQRPRMAQLDLTMPQVDPRDEYHSSYQRSHTGEYTYNNIYIY